MNPDRAYDEIKSQVAAWTSATLVYSEFSKEAFGNFVISFSYDEREFSVVCDRGQVFLCRDLKGVSGCDMIVSRLAEVDAAELLAEIKARL